jgi:TonB family protein
MLESKKLESKRSDPQSDRRFLELRRARNSADPKNQSQREPQQRRMMLMALALLMIALGFALYRDRDFWFPDAQDGMDAATPATQTVTAAIPPAHPGVAKATAPVVASKRSRTVVAEPAKDPTPSAASDPPAAQIQRTVLPPLEVEVVAGDAHRTIRPGSNSVQVYLRQPSSSLQEIPETAASPATAPSLTKAAEHVQMSADTSEVVSRSVRPGYPMLARQMKVQGSVILQALISRDGAIQDLQVMSGPPILAGAAREAVKQWRFKPHYLGAEAVETQAKITVNFTISTN